MKRKIIMSLILCLSFACEASEGNEMVTADEIIKALDLKPLPEEGGYFRETYRSGKINAPATIFGIDSQDRRSITTAIYYMVVPESFSALHRVKSDEIFHFYSGDTVEMIQIDEQGQLTRFTIGSDILNGEVPQVVVRKGVWQALKLKDGGSWALMGTTVSPGFEFADFEVGRREQMLKEFPQHSEDVIKFSRAQNEKTH